MLNRAAALGVHLYTASGVVCSLFIAEAAAGRRPREACLWMLAALFIDSSDGTLARWLEVKRHWPRIDGRKIDDIVDYLNYTFLPLLLIARMDWLPEPGAAWIVLPLVTSLFAFANLGAKEEDEGFFLGFPSYWNVLAIYLHLIDCPPLLTAAVVTVLGILTVAPLRFLYPSRMPRFRGFFIAGGVVWILALAVLLLVETDRQWPAMLTMLYPAAYWAGSFWLDFAGRRGFHEFQ